MKAVVVHGPDDVRVDEVTDPVPGPGEVVVAMEWGGICGSDISYWRHGGTGTAALEHPMVLGHEIAGRVVQVGPEVAGAASGMPVTVHPAELVGPLPDRLGGRSNLHPRVRYFGSAAFRPHTDGGFSEFRTVRADQLRPLPDGVSTRHGALAEPLGVALHAVNRAGSVAGRRLLVNGAGPIGALIVAVATFRGASEVIAADIAEPALRIAEKLGAHEVRRLASGNALPEDVELVFEASGVPGALGPVLAATARGGTIVQVGNLPGKPAAAALGDLVTREITWVGAYRFVDEISDAVAALRDGLHVDPLITHTFDLNDAGKALAVAADRSSGSGKVLLRLDRMTAGNGKL